MAQQIQATGFLDAAGNPEPAVWAYSGDAGPIHWSMCPPGGGKCRPLAVTNGIADPGPQPGGTVFKVTVALDGRTYSESLRWRGALGVARPPTLTGNADVGAALRVRPARWSGGWGTEHDDLGIEACRTVRASDCVMLMGPALSCSVSGCGELGGAIRGHGQTEPDYARVGNWYTGWFLFALDAHLGNPTSLIIGYASPQAIKPWPKNATIARSRPYGPVTGPPRPQVTVLPRARVRGRQVRVVTVHCAVPCSTEVTVTLSPPTASQRVTWTGREVVKGTRTIGVSGELPAGRVMVSVQVGNGPYVKGPSLIP